MGFDHLMHERNRYKKKPPDFLALAKRSSALRKLCTLTTAGKVILDFKNDEVIRVLAEVLLREDFGIDVRVPQEYLVPRIPQRLNYVLVVEDLVELNGIAEDQVVGLDIGTGPISIYPLLTLHQNPKWRMYASELDSKSCELAKENVQRNYRDGQITVIKADSDSYFEKILILESTLTFCMCNPPFFDQDELDSKFNQSEHSSAYTNDDQFSEARSRTIAQQGELSVDGGEVQFVCRMIDESLVVKKRVRIYTSLLGKKSSLVTLKQYLKSKEISTHHDWTIGQGRTCRWILAWTVDETILLK